ncbi:MAG: Trk system potassium transporter TrkA [Clostridia bacterium]|nr:Trk system potassium transporter TrkA [Clostridia bacterium]
MRIIIVGAGTVGTVICTRLAQEHHNITLIDHNVSVLNEMNNKFDVIAVEGNGATVSTLRKAGADKADLLIAVTNQDELNILCCASAKKLGTKHTIARVRNPEYGELMQMIKQDLNLSLTINPELAVAKEITRMLRFPFATKIDTCYHGRVELAEFVISENSPLCGMTLAQLHTKLNIRYVICGVLRKGQAYIPKGDFILAEGDNVCLTAHGEEMINFFKAIGAYKHPVKDVLIVGGGRMTYYLLNHLQKTKIRATVIEPDKQRCRELAEKFDCNVIREDGTNQSVLKEEGIAKTDAFLALSSQDEENAIVSLYAKSQNTKKIITLISAMQYVELFKGMGLDGIVSPKYSTSNEILRYVRSLAVTKDIEIESLHKLMEDNFEALECVIKEPIEGITGIPLKNLKLRRDVLLASIIHKDKVIIPSGNDKMESGDTVILFTSGVEINDIKDILK